MTPMTLPENLAAFLGDMRDTLGDEGVNVAPETILRYGETTLPGPDQPPGAVLYPGSPDAVQRIVQAANRHRVALYPISNGNNIGLGSRAPVVAGQVVVDLGRRMNRILEINEETGVAVIEPGVTYRQLADELDRLGGKFMPDVTSGPPEGSVLGNALDKGAGYTPYADHLGMTCGMEVVLGNGSVIRTGDASLGNARHAHMSKYTYGPHLDGLFAQSNFGIVTRVGIWLMPRPPAIRFFGFSFDDDDAIGAIIDAIRPLKLSNFVPTMMRVSNDLWMAISEEPYPGYREGVGALPDDERRALRQRHGVGAWTISGAFYGASMAALQPQIDRVRAHFQRLPGARYIDHDAVADHPPLQAALDAYSGKPGFSELRQLAWRPGGGLAAFTPGVPMNRALVEESSHMSRRILNERGLDYVKMYVCGPRFARGLHHLVWNRTLATEDAAADDAYRALVMGYAGMGMQCGRAPLKYQALHWSILEPAVRDTCNALKSALDPNHVIAPGRYGIG